MRKETSRQNGTEQERVIERQNDSGSKSKSRKRGTSPMRIVIIIIATYLVVCLLVFLFQNRLLYFPSRGYFAAPADIGLEYEEVRLTTSDGLKLAAWFIEHPDALGSVIFCHGNAGNMADRLDVLKLLSSMKVNVLIFDYRGYGESEGSPSELGLYEDAETAWRFLTETKSQSPESIVLVGRSLGGGVVAELARRHTPGGLVIDSSFTSIVDVGKEHYRFLPVSLLVRQRFESIDKVPHIKCPKLFFHSTDDSLIPIRLGNRLFQAAAEPKEFVETPGGHGTGGLWYNDDTAKKMTDFLEDVLNRH